MLASLLFLSLTILTTPLQADPPPDLPALLRALDGNHAEALQATASIGMLGAKAADAIPALREKLGDPETDPTLRQQCTMARLFVGGDLTTDLDIMRTVPTVARMQIAQAILLYGVITGGSFLPIDRHATTLCALAADTIRDAPADAGLRLDLVSGAVALLTTGLPEACEEPLLAALRVAAKVDREAWRRSSGVLGCLDVHPLTNEPIVPDPDELHQTYLRQRGGALTFHGGRFLVGGWTEQKAMAWVSGSIAERTLFITDATSGQVLRHERTPGQPLPTLAFTGNTLLASGGAGSDGRQWLHVLDLGGADLRSVALPIEMPRCEVIAAAGSRVVAFGFRRLVTLDLADRPPVATSIASDYVGPGFGLCLTADGERLLVPDEHLGIQIRDARSGDLIDRLEGHAARITSIAVSADGRRAVSGDLAGRALLWDLDRNALEHELPASAPGVAAVAITPDGSRVALGLAARIADDGSFAQPELAGRVRIIDGATGAELARFSTLPMHVLKVAIANQGDVVAAMTLWHVHQWSLPK